MKFKPKAVSGEPPKVSLTVVTPVDVEIDDDVRPAPPALTELLYTRPPSLIQIIEEVQADKQVLHSFFRPSMIAGCDRQNVFHALNAPYEPKKVSYKLERTLENGTATHAWIQGYITAHPGWWFAPESKIASRLRGFTVRGSCDGIMIRRADNYRFAIEIKTIASAGYKELTRAKPQHVEQAAMYAYLHGCAWIKFLYINKDNMDLREFDAPMTDTLRTRCRDRVAYLGGFLERKELPKFDRGTCDRTFCNFVTTCRKAGAPV